MEGGSRFVRHAERRAIGDANIGPIELKLQDARLTPAQKLTVQRTTGCTPDVRYHNCRTHRSMLMVYGPPHSLHAAAELAEALVDFNAGLGHMPILAKYSQPTVLRQMMQPMHMHPMQQMQPMHMHPAQMQYTPPMGIYLPRDCDRRPSPALPYLVLFAIYPPTTTPIPFSPSGIYGVLHFEFCLEQLLHSNYVARNTSHRSSFPFLRPPFGPSHPHPLPSDPVPALAVIFHYCSLLFFPLTSYLSPQPFPPTVHPAHVCCVSYRQACVR